MDISCVVPTHGRPDLLRVSLGSILAQSKPAAEIVVVDDLGDDRTAATVHELQKTTQIPLHLVVNHVQPGACGSRNLGATKARHDTMAFLDDDDIWYAEYLERVAGRFERGDVDVVVAGLLRRDLDGTLQSLTTREGLTPDTLFDQRSYMTGSNVAIRKRAFEKAGRFDPAVPVWNDYDLFIRIVNGAIPYAVLPETLVEWREHPGDRITRPSLRRASGLETFVRKHHDQIPPAFRQELRAMALGIRRRHTTSILHKAALALQLARVIGFGEATKRIVRKTARSKGLSPL
ncbi:glycosyltransferase family 2 protein [Microvirga pudoricolor]|uniref:glycosyltransferase family 2 protein n=1 Tax=Microvirga pudoricolor TaxID=2778729 RepID=UPI0019503C63|nr:glycosyltransferase family 2 protein [Microvirga pudoricolor]MBM6596395.1 glycosyltransferase family 2 protein [Microvirga pudoricolor]